MVPICQIVTVIAFRGTRVRAFAKAFQDKLDIEKRGFGSGPSNLECQLFAGHVGVSTDAGGSIYGFNPDNSGIPTWQLFDDLKRGGRVPGIVRNDTPAFAAARNEGLVLVSIEVVLPELRFQDFQRTLDAERQKSQYYYGFPDGDGDCNCTTWLE
jgi:hypothetical protein